MTARGGTVLVDSNVLYIGAHAAVQGMPLLTRDATRYRAYLPKLEIIAPDSS